MAVDPWYRRRRRQAAGGTITAFHAVRRAAFLLALLIAALWLLEAVDTARAHALDPYGVTPRNPDELPQIFTAPFLHASFDHVAGNTLPLFVLGFLTAVSGIGRFLMVSLIVILVSGLGVWFVAAPKTVHLGASGLIFGYFGYLVLRALFDRRLRDLLVGIVVVAVYGFAVLAGVVPGTPGISWEAHFFGLIGGGIAAWVLRRKTVKDPVPA
jgi:membrane associated rhomboid family serine protease